MRYLPFILIVATIPTVAQAQRADENAVTDAEDAFGSNVGGEDLGLYTPFSVRGFSPTDAGNVRLEALFFDRQAEFTGRLVEGNRVRIGPSASTYAFPAPSGIADYRLRRAGSQAVLSIVGKIDSFGAGFVEADGKLPLAGERLGVAAGIGWYKNELPASSTATVLSTATIATWRPRDGFEITPFWSRIKVNDEEAQPIFLGSGNALPPRLRRREFIGQNWADNEAERLNYGVLSRLKLTGSDVRLGLFRSINRTDEAHTLLYGTAPLEAVAPRRVTADPARRSASTSGELTVSRGLSSGRFEHEVRLSIRGREQRRTFGGSASSPLTAAPFGHALAVDRPHLTFGSLSRDGVSQRNLGLSWQARLPRLGGINAGVQRVWYEKSIVTPSEPRATSKSAAWLYNITASLDVTRRVNIYAATTAGLEESRVAPETAVNRNEAPPALRTRQYEGGVQWRIARRTTLIAGMFNVEKPYYGLDPANLFRRMGDVRHRGLELSLTGTPAKGLNLVAGAVLLDAELSGEDVSSGAIGRRPVGIANRTAMLSVDYRPPSFDRLSFDLSAEHNGRMAANVENTVWIAPKAIINAGLRYRFDLARKPAVLRFETTNLFNSYGWNVVASHAFTYIEPRRVSLRLALDL